MTIQNNIATLTQLEPIMQRLGIWPKNVGFAPFDVPTISNTGMETPTTMPLPDHQLLAIVRDAAERWLGDRNNPANLLGISTWQERDFGEPEYEFERKTVDGLLAALEYAERTGDSQ